MSTSAQHQRWRQHFTKVLNIVSEFDQSEFDPSELDQVRERVVGGILASVLSASDVRRALSKLKNGSDVRRVLSKLKNGKTAGSSGILPEMLKVGRKYGDFVEMLMDLLSEVWQVRQVPQEWVDAILVPIPKKGSLRTLLRQLEGDSSVGCSGQIGCRAACRLLRRWSCRNLSVASGNDVAAQI